MAGRGRGKTGSLTQEQLQSLGCVGKDMPQVQTAPPPTYPPLMSKPVNLETSSAQSYQLLWKEDFLNHMRDSPYFLQTLEKSKINQSILSYSQKNNDSEANKLKPKAEFNWTLMPAELQVCNRKRKTAANCKDVKKTKAGNIEDRLKQLEEKELNENDKEKENKTNSDSEQEAEEDEEVADDEMDDENDYGNSYFDNGEAYNEEDDNLDDGPVY